MKNIVKAKIGDVVVHLTEKGEWKERTEEQSTIVSYINGVYFGKYTEIVKFPIDGVDKEIANTCYREIFDRHIVANLSGMNNYEY